MDFLLKMQVPDGQLRRPAWSTTRSTTTTGPRSASVRTQPETQMTRSLWPTSTAATLNLAATAAQATRSQRYDPTFAKTVPSRPRKAWAAAITNPAIFARHVRDRWRAVRRQERQRRLLLGGGGALHHDQERHVQERASERSTHCNQDAEGARSGRLAVLDDLGRGDRRSGHHFARDGAGRLARGNSNAQRQKIEAAADTLPSSSIPEQGYRMPFKADASGGYPWGSNSFILTTPILVPRFTERCDQYLEGTVAEGMDYLLGRNALLASRTSPAGASARSQPHHRFWAQQAGSPVPRSAARRASFPVAQSGLQDPYVKAAGLAG